MTCKTESRISRSITPHLPGSIQIYPETKNRLQKLLTHATKGIVC